MTNRMLPMPIWRTAATVGLLCVLLAAPGPSFAQGQGAAVVKKLATGGSVTKASLKSRTGANAATSAASAKPALVGTFGDWGVYVSQTPKTRICYALAQPKSRLPASLKRDSAYIFISNRPGEGVRGEVSMIMGMPLKEGGDGGRAEVGSAKFDLVDKGQNAFVKNAAEESQFVDTLKKRGSKLVIKVPAAKGGPITDTYSLAGFAPALDRVAKECP